MKNTLPMLLIGSMLMLQIVQYYSLENKYESKLKHNNSEWNTKLFDAQIKHIVDKSIAINALSNLKNSKFNDEENKEMIDLSLKSLEFAFTKLDSSLVDIHKKELDQFYIKLHEKYNVQTK